jgi:hypothetical protein
MNAIIRWFRRVFGQHTYTDRRAYTLAVLSHCMDQAAYEREQRAMAER